MQIGLRVDPDHIPPVGFADDDVDQAKLRARRKSGGEARIANVAVDQHTSRQLHGISFEKREDAAKVGLSGLQGIFRIVKRFTLRSRKLMKGRSLRGRNT